MALKRTAQCKKCGEVLLKIEPGVGEVTYVCKKCNSEVGIAACEDYETLVPTCDKCGSDIFKVKITEEDSDEFWAAKCVNCESEPEAIYVNSEGKVITEEEREELIRQDRIDSLEEELNSKDELIQDLEEKIDMLNFDIQAKDTYINRLIEDLEDNEDGVSNLKREVKEKDDYISELEYKVFELERKLSDFQ